MSFFVMTLTDHLRPYGLQHQLERMDPEQVQYVCQIKIVRWYATIIMKWGLKVPISGGSWFLFSTGRRCFGPDLSKWIWLIVYDCQSNFGCHQWICWRMELRGTANKPRQWNQWLRRPWSWSRSQKYAQFYIISMTFKVNHIYMYTSAHCCVIFTKKWTKQWGWSALGVCKTSTNTLHRKVQNSITLRKHFLSI